MAGKDPKITAGLTIDVGDAYRDVNVLGKKIEDHFAESAAKGLAKGFEAAERQKIQDFRRANPQTSVTARWADDDGTVLAKMTFPSWEREQAQERQRVQREDATRVRLLRARTARMRYQAGGRAMNPSQARALFDEAAREGVDIPPDLVAGVTSAQNAAMGNLPLAQFHMARASSGLETLKTAIGAAKAAREERASFADKAEEEQADRNRLRRWGTAGKQYTGGTAREQIEWAKELGNAIPAGLESRVNEAIGLKNLGMDATAEKLLLDDREKLAQLEQANKDKEAANIKAARDLSAKEKDAADKKERDQRTRALGGVYAARTLISGIGGRAGELLTGDPWATSYGGQAALGMVGDVGKGVSNWGATRIAATGKFTAGAGTALIGGAIASEVMDVFSKLAARGAGIAKYATGVQSDWMMNYGMLTGAGPTQYDQIMGTTLGKMAAARPFSEGGIGIPKPRTVAGALTSWGFDKNLGDLGAQVQWKRQREDLFGKMRAFANDTAGDANEALGRIAGASQGARLSQSDIGDAFAVLRRQGIASGGKGVGSMLAMRAFGAGGNVDAAASILNRAAGGFNLGPGGLEGLQQMSANLTGSLLGLGASGDVTMQSANAFGGLSAAGVSMQRVPGVTQSYLSDIAGARGMLGGNSFGKLRQSAIMLAALNRAGGDPMKAASEVANVGMDEQRSTALSTFGSELSTTAFAMGGMSRGEAERYAGGQGQLQGEEVKLPPASWYARLQSAINNANNVANGSKNLGEIGSLERTNAILNSIAINLNNIVSGLGAGMFFGGGS